MLDKPGSFWWTFAWCADWSSHGIWRWENIVAVWSHRRYSMLRLQNFRWSSVTKKTKQNSLGLSFLRQRNTKKETLLLKYKKSKTSQEQWARVIIKCLMLHYFQVAFVSLVMKWLWQSTLSVECLGTADVEKARPNRSGCFSAWVGVCGAVDPWCFF